MIDLHCHILPGMDDGAQTSQESMEMALCALEDGIHTIVATPHSANGIYHNPAELIENKIRELRKLLEAHKIPLDVCFGAEIRIHENLADGIYANQNMTINQKGRYALVEFPHDMLPPGICQVLFQLIVNGVTPVLAHPERNTAIQHNPKPLFDLVNMGCLVQLTAMSITGELGRDAMQTAHLALRHRLAHVIATDSHNADARPPILSQAVAAARDILGDFSEVYKMVADNPRAIIAGKSFNPPAPLPIESRRRKRWPARLFGYLISA